MPVDGTATVEVDAETNSGRMEVLFNGTITPEKGKTFTGDIRIVYEEFSEGSAFWEGGIADFVYLHGDSGQEAPVMPKVKSYLASWGPADVYANGELIYQDLIGHMMYTEGSRDGETYADLQKRSLEFLQSQGSLRLVHRPSRQKRNPLRRSHFRSG